MRLAARLLVSSALRHEQRSSSDSEGVTLRPSMSYPYRRASSISLRPHRSNQLIALDRKTGKEVGSRDVSADEFNTMRREALQKNMLAELSTISPEWYRFAKQSGVSDAQLKLAQDKFGEDKRQFGERMGFEREKHADDKYFKGEDL